MSDQVLTDAIDRAERAMTRLERVAAAIQGERQRGERLRHTVRDVVSELDSILGAGNR